MLVENFKTTLSGYVRYRGQGHYVFLLHRITGLGTLLFLAIHILDTAVVYFAPAFYADAIAIYRSTPFMLGEIALVFCVIFHGANGLRIAYFDLVKPGASLRAGNRAGRADRIELRDNLLDSLSGVAIRHVDRDLYDLASHLCSLSYVRILLLKQLRTENNAPNMSALKNL